jgi:hypothetical protein
MGLQRDDDSLELDLASTPVKGLIGVAKPARLQRAGFTLGYLAEIDRCSKKSQDDFCRHKSLKTKDLMGYSVTVAQLTLDQFV